MQVEKKLEESVVTILDSSREKRSVQREKSRARRENQR